MATKMANELKTFRENLPSLLADPAKHGQFALIFGETIAGLFPTVDAALEAGYEKFELSPFLVMEVAEQIEPLYFSRNSVCPS